MKTVEQWAQELPEDVREKFLANVVIQRRLGVLKCRYERLSTAIEMSIIWQKTPEGNSYWSTLFLNFFLENR